tara:strand:+ start:183 stop:425 length:243 start_codon:yes stop_codon:yes gene_type:complete
MGGGMWNWGVAAMVLFVLICCDRCEVRKMESESCGLGIFIPPLKSIHELELRWMTFTALISKRPTVILVNELATHQLQPE